MDWSQYQGLGYGTAVAVLAIAAVVAIFRSWRERDKLKELRDALKAKYAEAVDARDLDRAAAIANKLRDIEAALR